MTSERELRTWLKGQGLNRNAHNALQWMNAKITSGELMVVKTVELWHPSVPEEEWKKWLTGSDAEFSMLVTKCCSKNPWCPPWGHGKGVWDAAPHLRLPRMRSQDQQTMSNWSTNSNWYYVCCLLVAIALWLWRDLREANERKRHLCELAKNLSDRVYELEMKRDMMKP